MNETIEYIDNVALVVSFLPYFLHKGTNYQAPSLQDFQIFLILFFEARTICSLRCILAKWVPLAKQHRSSTLHMKKDWVWWDWFQTCIQPCTSFCPFNFCESLPFLSGPILATWLVSLSSCGPTTCPGFCQASKPSTTMMASTVPDKALASTGSGQVEMSFFHHGLWRKKITVKSSACWNNHLTPRCLFGG